MLRCFSRPLVLSPSPQKKKCDCGREVREPLRELGGWRLASGDVGSGTCHKRVKVRRQETTAKRQGCSGNKPHFHNQQEKVWWFPGGLCGSCRREPVVTSPATASLLSPMPTLKHFLSGGRQSQQKETRVS